MIVDRSRLLVRTNHPDVAETVSRWERLIVWDKHPPVMTKFGGSFLADPEGRAHWLDVLEGTCKPVAGSVAEFERLLAREEQLDLRFTLPWRYRLQDEGHGPIHDPCFGFKVPPRLGAPVESSNVEVGSLPAYQVWMAEVAEVPPGTTVSHVTVNGEMP